MSHQILSKQKLNEENKFIYLTDMLRYVVTYLNDKYAGSLMTSEIDLQMQKDIDVIITNNSHLIKRENVILEFKKENGMMSLKVVGDNHYQPEELI